MTEGPAEVGELADETAVESGGRHQLARLESDVQRANARAERAERALERTQRSASYVVGNLLVRAAKDPKRLLTLPRDLWRIWKMRRSRRKSPDAAPAGARTRRDAVLDIDAPRLLIPRTSVAPATRGSLAVAGALSHRTERAWAPYAAVSSALPHEAAALIEAVDADIVVIDTAAALPGESWAYLGDPAAVDRMRAAAALVDAAHAQGRPVVLLRTTPPSHTVFLSDLAARCDLVLDGPGSVRERPWHPGIDPAVWQVGAMPHSSGVFVAAESSTASPQDRELRASVLAAVHADRLRTPDPRLHRTRALAHAIKSSAWGIADPMSVAPERMGAGDTALALLAAGRKVVGGPDADLATLLSGHAGTRGAALLVDDPQGLPDAIAAAATPMTDAQRRAVLRALVLEASAPVQLSVLADLVDVEARPRAVWDVALVMSDLDDVDQLLLQSWRPREVVVQSGAPARAVDALAAEDIIVTPLPAEVVRQRSLLDMAVTTPLIASQVDLNDPHALVDLLVEQIAGLPPLPRSSDSVMWSTP